MGWDNVGSASAAAVFAHEVRYPLRSQQVFCVRVLIVNKFLHHVGGVETYMDWQASNLHRIGIETHFFGMEPPAGREVIPSLGQRYSQAPNREFNASKRDAAISALNSIYSPMVKRMLSSTIEEFRPDLVHFHSTCRQLTPSVARAVTQKAIPSVLTAHEYKQVCATQRLWDDRQNRVCTACLSGNAMSRMRNVAVRRCVRGSTAASIFAIPEIPIADHLWAKSGVLIHAPSKFIGDVMRRAPYIPNRVQTLDLPWGDPEERATADGWEKRVISVGRLEKEKGVDVLLDAWKIVNERNSDAQLTIAGSGSERNFLEAKALSMGLTNIEFIGRYERSRLSDLLGRAAVSVHPAKWFENSPYAVRESLLFGVPAIVTDVGGMPEMIDERCGTVVRPNDPADLSQAIIKELACPRAGSKYLRDAVAARAVSNDAHLKGLENLYSAAAL